MKCYVWTNPATGNKIYYKQTLKNVVCIYTGRNELVIKPKNWLYDIPQHKEKKINIGIFNEQLRIFLKQVE